MRTVPWSWAWGNCVRADSRLTVTGPDQLSPPPSRFRHQLSLLPLDFFQVAPAVKPSPTSSKIAVAALPVDNLALARPNPIPTFPGFLLGFGAPLFCSPTPTANQYPAFPVLVEILSLRSNQQPPCRWKRLGSLALAQQASQGRARPPSNTYLIYRYLRSSILRRFPLPKFGRTSKTVRRLLHTYCLGSSPDLPTPARANPQSRHLRKPSGRSLQLGNSIPYALFCPPPRQFRFTKHWIPNRVLNVHAVLNNVTATATAHAAIRKLQFWSSQLLGRKDIIDTADYLGWNHS